MMRATFAALCALLIPVGAQAAETLPLGEPGRTKYLSFDAEAKKLYIAHDTEVTVVGIAPLGVSGHVTGLNAARAVALAPNGHGYVTSGRNATVTVFDAATNGVLSTVPAGRDANAIAYDPVSHRMFVMNDDDGTITVIDTTHDRAIKTIPLPGGEGVEAAAADGQGHVYVSHSAAGDLLRVNTETASVDAHFPLAGCPDPAGLALDPANDRAFIACLNGLLIVLDTATGRTVTTLPIGLGSQAVIYDAQRKRLFSANADATVSVIAVNGAGSYRLLPPIGTLPGARTAAEDPATGQLYLPAGSTLLVVSP